MLRSKWPPLQCTYGIGATLKKNKQRSEKSLQTTSLYYSIAKSTFTLKTPLTFSVCVPTRKSCGRWAGTNYAICSGLMQCRSRWVIILHFAFLSFHVPQYTRLFGGQPWYMYYKRSINVTHNDNSKKQGSQ